MPCHPCAGSHDVCSVGYRCIRIHSAIPKCHIEIQATHPSKSMCFDSPKPRRNHNQHNNNDYKQTMNRPHPTWETLYHPEIIQTQQLIRETSNELKSARASITNHKTMLRENLGYIPEDIQISTGEDRRALAARQAHLSRVSRMADTLASEVSMAKRDEDSMPSDRVQSVPGMWQAGSNFTDGQRELQRMLMDIISSVRGTAARWK
jgi:hypothetical protein